MLGRSGERGRGFRKGLVGTFFRVARVVELNSTECSV